MNDSPKNVAAILRVPRRGGYRHEDTPSPRDARITDLVRTLRAERDYARTAAAIEGLGETLLLAFSERVAVQAVRRCDATAVEDGLRAAALASAVDDPRNIAIAQALLWHSTEILANPAEDLFRGVARQAGRFGTLLSQFADRHPRDRTIQAMGYSAQGQGEMFSYRCDW
ncbi:hypothetical protein ABZ883_22720 [Streptomyces sp. NPDC046977]|uniref:hypothetical protein n=1 Tax=Streptomyces sp. NPDC046977 TaxID=3154703 RepID=UPI0033C1BDB3